jgi:hypothetical protein
LRIASLFSTRLLLLLLAAGQFMNQGQCRTVGKDHVRRARAAAKPAEESWLDTG